MQIALPFETACETHQPSSTQPPPASVLFVRHRRARRYVLRVKSDGTLRVTVPWRGSRREAMAFVKRQALWIERQRRELSRVVAASTPPWGEGTVVWLRGEAVTLRLIPSDAGLMALLGSEAIRVEGRADDLRPLVERHLRGLALRELPARVLDLAARHRLAVTKVSVRNQRWRWGSCSRSGHVCVNWRLVQTPPLVCDYVLLHELMHLKRQDHSPRFWKLVAAVCPEFETARAWLRTHGRTLYSEFQETSASGPRRRRAPG